MCIIVVVPYGEKLPSIDVFKICAKNNPDGMGFMYRKNKKVVINKGFFNVDKMYNEIKKIEENTEICIHFRYATHGKTSSSNCHPFPLTNDVNKLRQKKISCEIGIAHNGIIQGMVKDNDLSDTMVFIKSLNVDNVKKIPDYIPKDSGKFLIMTKFKTYIIGDFVYENGIYYSNDGYKNVDTYTYSTSLLAGKYDPFLEGCEMCEYCKHQYIEEDVTNKKIVDPCIDCDGQCNFELSIFDNDKRKYYQDFEDFEEEEEDDAFFHLNNTKEDVEYFYRHYNPKKTDINTNYEEWFNYG